MRRNDAKRSQQYKMIGLNIAFHRKLKGMTQLQLAEAANISRTHISNIEAPNVPTAVSLEILLNIADALGVSVACFFDFEKDDYYRNL